MVQKNYTTETAVLKIGEVFDLDGGIALVCKYENQNLLSKTKMKQKKVLEFGCGSLPACFGISNNKMPRDYIATDLTKKLLDAAKKVDNRPKYKIQSAVKPTLPKNSFDLIIMRGVLHHLYNPTQSLKKISKLLKKKGEILIYEPNLSSLAANFMKWILKSFFKTDMEESPYGQLAQDIIKKDIRDAGLKLQEVWYSSLLAFPLTGDYGRKKILPDNKYLFKLIIATDKLLSSLLNKIPFLANYLHFRVIFLAKKISL